MILSLKETLTKSLIEKGLLSEEKLKEALRFQKDKGGDLKDILVEKGFAAKEDIVSVLSQQLNIPPINLKRLTPDPAILKLISRETAQRYHIIPISKIEDIMTVAMSDPLNVFALDHVGAVTHFKIIPVMCSKEDLENAIREYYEEPAYEEIDKIISKMAAPEQLEIVKEVEEEAPDPERLIRSMKEAPVIKLADRLLSDAVKLRASDILIEPFETQTRIRYRIDGALRQIQVFPKYLHAAVVSRFKVVSSLDIAEQRLPQDGRFKVRADGKEVDFRISVLPSSLGEKVALRVLDKSVAMLDIERLGFNKRSMGDLRKAIERPHGMILICGPTGSGKTTTMYSLLKILSTSEENIVTVEDPIEYQLAGLNQVTSRPEMGLTFANALRAILRQDPDIIMIGEIRDYDTADISIKAALTGHLLLTTLHTTTATGALVRLINIGVEPFLIASSVILSEAQRLVRRLCPECKEPYQLDDSLKQRLGIKQKGKITLFRGKGCGFCLNMGYKGRVVLAETLMVTPLIKKLISEKAEEHKMREAARIEGMITLREDGIQKALDGIISIEEALRVTAGEQDLEMRPV